MLQRPAVESLTKYLLDTGFGLQRRASAFLVAAIEAEMERSLTVFIGQVSRVGKPEVSAWQIRLESALILTGLKALLDVRPLPHPGFCLFVSFPEDPQEQRRES